MAWQSHPSPNRENTAPFQQLYDFFCPPVHAGSLAERETSSSICMLDDENMVRKKEFSMTKKYMTLPKHHIIPAASPACLSHILILAEP